jgi:uncharacterized protein (DUF488 family)
VRRVLDIRLRNTSQIAGFTKKQDLAYFLNVIAGIEYEHNPELAPTDDILDGLKKRKGSWETYEERFLALMDERGVLDRLHRSDFAEPSCLLCSEKTPERCHRRLVAEQLQAQWPGIEVIHL